MTYTTKVLYPHVFCILPKSDICVIPEVECITASVPFHRFLDTFL
jgi:hypothetical protein